MYTQLQPISRYCMALAAIFLTIKFLAGQRCRNISDDGYVFVTYREQCLLIPYTGMFFVKLKLLYM